MSLFGSPMGDDDDLIFESSMPSMRHMRYMMNSLFNDPFGMSQNAITNDTHRSRNPQNDLQMMQFGFPPMMFNMDRLFPNFDNMAPNGNCHSFTSRSVMTMASGPDGQPQVYQETMSTTTAPGGVKETKKTVCDSHTGVKKMAIGHHIGERAHILEREHNVRSGEQEERQEFINLEEEEAESFNNEWETRTRHAVGAIGNSRYGAHGHRSRPDHRQLALPDPSGSRYSNSSRWTPSPRRNLRLPPTSKTHTSAPALSNSNSNNNSNSNITASSANAIGNRKREHTPEAKVCKKRHAVSDSNI
ncbi:myeloid leukemia factor isoform X4 [Colletes gigas]|uniref:myeloid leukemia factor isoform X4 n=1 Tax=Colletes gigas TaxID=935657 RepID=UPI001C9B9BB7|nr:myeloid leukemia factor isoform X4 [Colletes gigas]